MTLLSYSLLLGAKITPRSKSSAPKDKVKNRPQNPLLSVGDIRVTRLGEYSPIGHRFGNDKSM
jgi:hypothetical protein